MIAQKDNSLSFIVDLDEFHKKVDRVSPAWINQLRAKGLARFRELGLPTTREEDWKYTNVAPVGQGRFRLSTPVEPIEKDALKEYLHPDDLNVVFVNGVFSKEYSHLEGLPKGIRILNLNEGFVHHEKEIAALWRQYEGRNEGTFVSLSKALLNHGVLIAIDPKVVAEKLIHLVYLTSSAQGEIVSAPCSIILVEASSEVKVLESHVSFSRTPYLVNALTDIVMDEDAKLFYGKAQKESAEAFHIATTRIWQKRDSQLNSFCLTAQGRLVRNDLNVILDGTGANAILNGLYIVRDAQHVDNHTSVDHRPPNCTSNQLYKGILEDSGRAVFNGKIFVRKEAQQTNSYQLNKNLLLGKGCRVDTKPQLEIFANDVRCTHGATIGQLSEDELFYLRARSIPKDLAVKILARGFVDDILNMIPQRSVTAKLNCLLKDKFSQFT